MARLGDLHEASILYNLCLRYRSDKIYVGILFFFSYDKYVFLLLSLQVKFFDA